MNPTILLTIDVEDWFQVENFKQCIPFSSWQSYELRVEKNTHRLLDLLDSVELQLSAASDDPSSNMQEQRTRNQNREPRTEKPEPRSQKPEPSNKIKATFFVLGWIAERLPHLVREIRSRGHEVASHGYQHNRCNQISSNDLKKDLSDTKKLLEDISGFRVYGYRAPSFSINDDILKIIEECGYLYDSSLNSFTMHGRYGHLNLSQNATRGIALQISRTQNPESLPREIHDSDSEAYFTGAEPRILYELPISNIKLGNSILPWGGGGYFRLIPFLVFRLGVQLILKKENAYLLYLHPWEIDPEQPKVSEASTFYRFRHYINLEKAYTKLSKFLESFNRCSFLTCHQYLEQINVKGQNL